MPTIKSVNCIKCQKPFSVTLKRYNESLKNNWNFYCSPSCLKEFRKTGRVLTCDNPNCSKKFYRASFEINPSRNFCSPNCVFRVNNPISKESKRKLKLSLKEPKFTKECVAEGCSNKIDFARKYCSNSCQKKAEKMPLEYYQTKCLKELHSFHKLHGRIPLKKEVPRLCSATRRAFGSWNKAIQIAGYEPNPVLFAHKNIALDGHICDSFSEMIIDNFLFSCAISHEINVPYPGNPKLTADFVVGKFWIEFFGLAGVVGDYDFHMHQKFQIAREHNLSLVAVYPNNLVPKFHLEDALEPVLCEYGKSFCFLE